MQLIAFSDNYYLITFFCQCHDSANMFLDGDVHKRLSSMFSLCHDNTYISWSLDPYSHGNGSTQVMRIHYKTVNT